MQLLWIQIRKHCAYFAGLVLWLLALGIFLLALPQADSFRWLTQWHSTASDFFLQYFTHIGDGMFALGVALALLLSRRRFAAAYIFSAYALSGIAAQLIKKMLWLPRPQAFFAQLGQQVYRVPGLELHDWGSFPSGHTTSAFALFTATVLWSKQQRYSVLWLLPAILVGYSRVYLSQHFPEDVWGGALLGSLTALALYVPIKQWEEKYKIKVEEIQG